MSARPASLSYRQLIFVYLTLILAGTTARAGLDLEARVACTRRVEAVYHDLRVWPADNKAPKPALDEVLPVDVTRRQVREALAASVLLEREWDAGVTLADLQAEMNRIARETHAPAHLRRLFAALGNDPVLVAECLVRPLLARERARRGYATRPETAAGRDVAFEAWLAAHLDAADAFVEPDGEDALTLPAVTGSPCAPDSWQPTARDLPARNGAAEVWTGTEMLLYGGGGSPGMAYAPATDTWRALSASNSPPGASDGVWTGTEMLTWGSSGCGRYNPATDVWKPIPSEGAPLGRYGVSVVWTGTEMIVWGGWDSVPHADGARFDAGANRWTPVSTLNTPSARSGHTAVWSGTEMIVWGGNDGHLPEEPYVNDGGRYDPATDTWRSISLQGAPSARSGHVAVWTGSEMILWGGQSGTGDTSWVLDTGARYSPTLDAWTALPATGAPRARRLHTAVWTGSEMIVWGGEYHDPFDPQQDALLADGGRYAPGSDSWRPLSSLLAPRTGHSAVWAAERGEMIVWGGAGYAGALTDGSRYRPAESRWYDIAKTAVPERREGHTAVWTGAEMIVWGGKGLDPWWPYLSSGGAYDPALDFWRTLGAGPESRTQHTAVWTGTEMLVYGGDRSFVGDPSSEPQWEGHADAWGFAPAGNTWRRFNDGGRRTRHTAVWTGTRMIVWGGSYFWSLDSPPYHFLSAPKSFDPATNTWTALTEVGAPAPRERHLAAWTGHEMIVWGGNDQYETALRSGGLYDPVSGSWRALPLDGAPPPDGVAGAWAGDRFVVWGGMTDAGAQIVPGAAAWSPLPTLSAPVGRNAPTATWTGREVVFWGGRRPPYDNRNDGGRYDPQRGMWLPLGTTNAPAGRKNHSAIWTGSHVIVWGGGQLDTSFSNTGGRYCACLAAPIASAPSLDVTRSGGAADLLWSAAADAEAYDVVAGSLAKLREWSGDFARATERCLGNDLLGTTVQDAVVPAAGDGTWYLVRGVTCAGGTYDEPAGGQVGPRDPGVASPGSGCP